MFTRTKRGKQRGRRFISPLFHFTTVWSEEPDVFSQEAAPQMLSVWRLVRQKRHSAPRCGLKIPTLCKNQLTFSHEAEVGLKGSVIILYCSFIKYLWTTAALYRIVTRHKLSLGSFIFNYVKPRNMFSWLASSVTFLCPDVSGCCVSYSDLQTILRCITATYWAWVRASRLCFFFFNLLISELSSVLTSTSEFCTSSTV